MHDHVHDHVPCHRHGYRSGRTLWSAIWWIVGLPSLAFAEGEDLPYVWNAPTVHLLWNDPYRLYPVAAVDGMADDVKLLFRANGISVRVHRMVPGVDPASIPEPRVHAVLHPVEPVEWNLHRDTMAAAVGERGKGHTIFVFYPSVMRALGQGGGANRGRLVDLSRAMSRVVAHELVHVLAPELGHASRGVMARSLSRRTLTKAVAILDRKSSLSARAAMRAVARSRYTAALAPTRAFWY